MSNLSSSLASRFPQFAGTTPETFEQNEPTKLRRAGILSYLDPSIPVFKPKTDGSLIKFRAITHPDKGYFAYEVRPHFGMGTQGHSFCCLSMIGENCPICEYRKALWNRGDKELASKFKYAVYHLMYGINRDEASKGPQVLPVTKNGLERIRGILPDPETGALRSIDSLVRGRDLYFRKKKENEAQDFFVMADFQLRDSESPLCDNEQIAITWLEFVMNHQISKSLTILPPDEMMRLAGLDKPQTQFPVSENPVSKTEDDSDDSGVGSTPAPLNSPPASLADQMAQIKAKIEANKTK